MMTFDDSFFGLSAGFVLSQWLSPFLPGQNGLKNDDNGNKMMTRCSLARIDSPAFAPLHPGDLRVDTRNALKDADFVALHPGYKGHVAYNGAIVQDMSMPSKVEATVVSEGFPPIAASDARVLILGTLPGQDSLRLRQYYGHRRNAFWPIITALLGLPAEAPYPDRAAALTRHRIALWDVCASAHRPGSLDSAIEPASVIVNDFAGFFAAHPLIERVYFNGGNAERLYRRLVSPYLPDPARALPMVGLPSTSPAHAGMPLAEKRRRWSAVVEAVGAR